MLFSEVTTEDLRKRYISLMDEGVAEYNNTNDFYKQTAIVNAEIALTASVLAEVIKRLTKLESKIEDFIRRQ